MAWRRGYTKPLPVSVVIRVNGAYMRLSDWLGWLLHRFGKYIDAEKNGTVWAHEGYLHPHSWKWAIPTRQVGSGRGTGWPHDDVIKWKYFPRNWPFVRGIHRSPVNSPHKGQWRGALMFSLICVWINDWVNNHEAGGLERYRAHYDAIVMWFVKSPLTAWMERIDKHQMNCSPSVRGL